MLSSQDGRYLPQMLSNSSFRTMPKVVADQRHKFESDELFVRLSREGEVRYTAHREKTVEERRTQFQEECRQGLVDISFSQLGTNLTLSLTSQPWSDNPEDRVVTQEHVDFLTQQGRVQLMSRFIMNGVCVRWAGWMDLLTLEGLGQVNFDEERAQAEDNILRRQIESFSRRQQENYGGPNMSQTSGNMGGMQAPMAPHHPAFPHQPYPVQMLSSSNSMPPYHQGGIPSSTGGLGQAQREREVVETLLSISRNDNGNNNNGFLSRPGLL